MMQELENLLPDVDISKIRIIGEQENTDHYLEPDKHFHFDFFMDRTSEAKLFLPAWKDYEEK